jgi:hypothetical protein
MFDEQPNRTTAVIELSFKQDAGFLNRISRLGGRLVPESRMPHWHSTGHALLVRDPPGRRVLIVNSQKVQLQALSLRAITEKMADHLALFQIVIDEFSLKSFDVASLRLMGSFDVGMSQHELADLLFGTYFFERGHYSAICDKPSDANLTLFGEKNDYSMDVFITPMTAEQSLATFDGTANLEHFADPKLFDPGLMEIRNSFDRDAFFVQVHLSKREISSLALKSFFSGALPLANQIATDAVKMVKKLPLRKSS